MNSAIFNQFLGCPNRSYNYILYIRMNLGRLSLKILLDTSKHCLSISPTAYLVMSMLPMKVAITYARYGRGYTTARYILQTQYLLKTQ